MITALDKIAMAKAASKGLAQASTIQKNEVLKQISLLLPARATEIIAANQIDLDRGVADGMTESLQDRLRLTTERIQDIADAAFAFNEAHSAPRF